MPRRRGPSPVRRTGVTEKDRGGSAIPRAAPRCPALARTEPALQQRRRPHLMAPSTDIVEQSSTALASGDFGAARSFLADDLHFLGPIDEFHRADDYLAALRQLFGMVRGVENQATVTQDAEVV